MQHIKKKGCIILMKLQRSRYGSYKLGLGKTGCCDNIPFFNYNP